MKKGCKWWQYFPSRVSGFPFLWRNQGDVENSHEFSKSLSPTWYLTAFQASPWLPLLRCIYDQRAFQSFLDHFITHPYCPNPLSCTKIHLPHVCAAGRQKEPWNSCHSNMNSLANTCISKPQPADTSFYSDDLCIPREMFSVLMSSPFTGMSARAVTAHMEKVSWVCTV